MNIDYKKLNAACKKHYIFMSRVYSRTYYENWLEKFFAQNLR